jgi:hypothetical protein
MCKLCMTNTLMLALKLPLSKLFACFHVWHIAREDFFIVTTLYLAQRSDFTFVLCQFYYLVYYGRRKGVLGLIC